VHGIYVPSHVFDTLLISLKLLNSLLDMSHDGALIVLWLHSNAGMTRKIKHFGNGNFSTLRIIWHLVSHCSFAEGNKQVVRLCTTIYELFA
jgi:hypothetical protein